jgi:hypothetical protein
MTRLTTAARLMDRSRRVPSIADVTAMFIGGS